MVDIAELTQHPERLDRDTLYELRSLLALYPYFQPARLLMLKNLYLLHDPAFDTELRRAAVYITDRDVLFQMVEGGHYQMKAEKRETPPPVTKAEQDSRTLSLIDDFLDSMPPEEGKEKKNRRKPTPADAAVDYVAYLMESEENEDTTEKVPQLKGQKLIDSFIEQDKGKITLNENPTLKPEIDTGDQEEEKDNGNDIYTETMARIYIKQGKYSRALEIIKRLSLVDSEKNAYFADQIRFLEKLITNSNKNNN